MEILQARKERLERHHNVLVSDEAMRAAVKLTDQYVTDRMRPDKAIDAIDEACAHMQAIVKYSPRTEQLIERRIAALKEQARTDKQQEEERRENEAATRQPSNAFERFGAELEALFVGAPVATGPGAREANGAPRPSVVPPLAPIEAELAHQLMEEGIVIRGHDIARVVGLMAGVEVKWDDSAPIP